ncbi:MAG: hypothetical protein WA977_08535 [Halobacteriota archaeon]
MHRILSAFSCSSLRAPLRLRRDFSPVVQLRAAVFDVAGCAAVCYMQLHRAFIVLSHVLLVEFP